MKPFNVVLVEGLFYEKGGSYYVEQDGGNHQSVTMILDPLCDSRVQIAVHHLPPNGIQSDMPGAGSCRYPNGIGCPVRHDMYPNRLLSFHLDGFLLRSPWRVRKFNGDEAALPLGGMVGHYGRLAGATILDVEAMREALGHLDPATLGVGAQDLAGVLARLRKTMEN